MSFIAQYRGECGSCEARIRPGDEIEYGADDVVVHVDCHEVEERIRPAVEVCKICWMTRPCEHDDERM